MKREHVTGRRILQEATPLVDCSPVRWRLESPLRLRGRPKRHKNGSCTFSLSERVYWLWDSFQLSDSGSL